MTIRELTKDDISQVVEIGRQMHRESQYRDLEFSVVKAVHAATAAIGHFDQCCFVAEGKDGTIIGVMAGYVDEYEYGYDLIAYDRLLYVVPEHRGGMLAARLIKRYERWAREMKAAQIHLGQTTDVEPLLVDALYQRLGYEPVGGCYRKEV